MHNREKYPEIWAAKEAAEAELAPLMAARELHTDAINTVQVEIDRLKAEKSSLNDLAMADVKKIAELREQISRMATAMGARRA